MMERYEHARQQAVLARTRALQSGNDAAQQEWLKVAELWEAIAHEYRSLANLSPTTGGSTAA